MISTFDGKSNLFMSVATKVKCYLDSQNCTVSTLIDRYSEIRIIKRVFLCIIVGIHTFDLGFRSDFGSDFLGGFVRTDIGGIFWGDDSIF